MQCGTVAECYCSRDPLDPERFVRLDTTAHNVAAAELVHGFRGLFCCQRESCLTPPSGCSFVTVSCSPGDRRTFLNLRSQAKHVTWRGYRRSRTQQRRWFQQKSNSYEQPLFAPVGQNGIGCPTGLRCSGESTTPSPLMLISIALESQNPMRKRPSPHSYVVIHGRTPEGFTDWSALSHVGFSVAEVFLEFRPQAEPLPEDFTRWDLPTMDQKSTIAHRAVMLGRPLPANFQAWDLLDPSGKTVITVAREAGNASVIAQYEAWVLAKGIGQPSSASDKPARPVAARIHRRGDI